MKNRHSCAPFLLDDKGARMIFAPFFHSDSKVSHNLPLRIQELSGSGCRLETFWDNTQARWDSCTPGETAFNLTWNQPENTFEYDRLILCLNTGRNAKVRARLISKKTSSNWFETSTNGKRGELAIPLNASNIQSIEIEAIPETNAPGIISLIWFGLEDSVTAALQEKRIYNFDTKWPGLVLPYPDWEKPKFARGLLFDANELPALRKRKESPGWKDVFSNLEKEAEKWLERSPEDEIFNFIPWSDGRYMREDQVRENLFYFGPQTLAIVGLVNKDERMLKQALRFLMAFLHTPHWCPPENRIIGATWNSKCFQEEMAVTHVALLADWLDFALTRHAKELVRTCIWHKGLAVIESDLMKYEYMWGINQGPWFCRARILGGLMLENKWPRTGGYVERAFQEMDEMMNNYILPDGGTDEGLSYFGLTLHAVLQGILAFAKAQDRDPMDLMPQNFDQVENFIATLTSTSPGSILSEGDASTSKIPGNAMAVLAKLKPNSIYSKVFAGSMETDATGQYMKQYVEFNELAFVQGPEVFEPASCIVPIFSLLPNTGHLTSCRSNLGHTIRIHLIGAKAGASHTHFDKGGIILEIDEQSILVDRGVVRYDDDRSLSMNRTCLHNTITPVRDDGSFPNQSNVLEVQIPTGSGDETTLDASIDISHVWRSEMNSCSRRIDSNQPFQFSITDTGELKSAGKIAFHLQALRPFIIENEGVRLPFDGGKLIIKTNWAQRIEQRVEGIDLQYRDIHHAIWYSGTSQSKFNIETQFHIEFDDCLNPHTK